MVGLWVLLVSVALVAGAAGAIAVPAGCVLVYGRRAEERVTPGYESVPAPDGAVRARQPSRVRRDVWLPPLNRCEQSVCRAARVVDSVSSVPARRALGGVVHRMEAELPNVRVLVELGCDLEEDATGQDGSAGRVHRRLVDAADRFGAETDAILAAVLQLVADPGTFRLHEQVAALRDEFPLLRPMSAVLGPEPPARPERSLVATPV